MEPLSSLNLLIASVSEETMEERKLISVDFENYGFQHYWILTYDNGEREIRYDYSSKWDGIPSSENK
jgi:hypothetical protein